VSTLSLQERYKALAEGRQLQLEDGFDGRWVDYDARKHPLNLANDWRIKPNVVEGFTCNLELFDELKALVKHGGAAPFDHIGGVMSQLDNIVAGAAINARELDTLKQKVEADKLKVEAYDYAQKEWERVQALCSRIAPDKCGHSVLTILCDRIEADEREMGKQALRIKQLTPNEVDTEDGARAQELCGRLNLPGVRVIQALCDRIEADEKLTDESGARVIKLRDALIACGWAVGATLSRDCSDGFLCDVRLEVEAVMAAKNREIAGLKAGVPITDADRDAISKVIGVIEKLVKAKR
jgi:hypothetical protein